MLNLKINFAFYHTTVKNCFSLVYLKKIKQLKK